MERGIQLGLGRIETAETWYEKPEEAKVEFPATWVPLTGWRLRAQSMYVPPTHGELHARGTWSHAYIAAFVSHGRWMAECPHCHSAQVASVTDKRFMCIECGNVAFEHQWLEVRWPSEKTRQQIEAALLVRPREENRNWVPSEKVKDLKKENIDHELPESL